MLKRGAEIAFENDPGNRYLPWIIALMAYLAALAIAGAFALDATATQWQSGRSDRLTVQLPPSDGALSGDRIARVLDLLRATPGVVTVRRLDRSELVDLLEPWLGSSNITPELPLPELIDVTVSRTASLDLVALENRLATAYPGAGLDDHGRWMDRLAHAALTMQVLALILAVLIAGTATATVVVATRASLVVHRDTIEILHLIGAQDSFIARAFERRALGLGLRGGVLGIIAAALTIAVLERVASGLDAPLMPQFDLSLLGLATLAALPLASAAIAMVTARLTVLKALGSRP